MQRVIFPAIEPLEKGLALSDSKTPTYYEDRATMDLLFFLVQLYFRKESVQDPTVSLPVLRRLINRFRPLTLTPTC